MGGIGRLNRNRRHSICVCGSQSPGFCRRSMFEKSLPIGIQSALSGLRTMTGMFWRGGGDYWRLRATLQTPKGCRLGTRVLSTALFKQKLLKFVTYIVPLLVCCEINSSIISWLCNYFRNFFRLKAVESGEPVMILALSYKVTLVTSNTLQ